MKSIYLCLLLSFAYFLAAQLGLSFAFEQANTSPVWPPTGIAIAAMLYFGSRVWPGILLGALVANLFTGVSFSIALGIAIGNTLEGFVASYLIVRFADVYPFNRIIHVVRFVAIVTFATMISASIGTSSLLFGDVIDKNSVSLVWATWWLGDLVGGVVVTPLLITWVRAFPLRQFLSRWMEVIALLSLAALLSSVIFNGWFIVIHTNYPLTYVFLPLAIWVAYRFFLHGATLFISLISILAIYGALHGAGPFVQESVNESLLLLQIFIGVMTITTLTLAASVYESRVANAEINY